MGNKFLHMVDRVVNIQAMTAALLIMLLPPLISVSVVLRYYFGISVGWVTDVSEFALYFIALLITPWVLKHQGHVGMDVVFAQLPLQAQRRLTILTSALAGAACGLFSYYSLTATILNYTEGHLIQKILQWPRWPFLAVVALLFLTLSIQFFVMTWRSVQDPHYYERTLSERELDVGI